MRRAVLALALFATVAALVWVRPNHPPAERNRPHALPQQSVEPILLTHERSAQRVSRALAARALAPKPKPVVHRVKPKPKPVVHHHVKPKPKPAPHVTVPTSAVKRYAYSLLGATQYACLASIISKEDYNWDPLKSNYGGSGAYGIPQALPGSKMASAGADWRTNGKTQVRWMVQYVDSRYGSACGAWAYWQAHGSY